MTDDAKQLINAFAALPPQEKHAVIVELARIADAGPVSDDELTQAGAEIFTMYDGEEAESGDTETR